MADKVAVVGGRNVGVGWRAVLGQAKGWAGRRAGGGGTGKGSSVEEDKVVMWRAGVRNLGNPSPEPQKYP
ncbi:hypothetical protein E2C01_004312 [Portunus trituberculatus]|uniref:Uncharacterized protein n=1 Tax=Portunus trituberculatus TaxID=210409 RepID=A0A5B7CQD0_PORTR|nr:hypothetical protein [Portunus trituberculatus]